MGIKEFKPTEWVNGKPPAITAEQLNRIEDGISNATTEITAEASARESADSALDEKITAEKNARTEADTALEAKITAEASARESAYYVGQDGMLHFKFKTGGITNG